MMTATRPTPKRRPFEDLLSYFSNVAHKAVARQIPVNERMILLLSSQEAQDEYCADLIDHLPRLLQVGNIENRAARGAILFFIMHCLPLRSDALNSFALKAGMTPSNLLMKISGDDDFLQFLIDFHKIPTDLKLKQLRYHACGTTSLIFKARTQIRGDCALKVIRPEYVRNQDMIEVTASCARAQAFNHRYSAEIFESHDTWILMEFIDGYTLSDYVGQLRKGTTFLSETYVTHASSLLLKLITALSYYEERSQFHGDLTPLNIMVITLDDKITPAEIKLIDFGPNYVLRGAIGHRILFLEAFSNTELFLPPGLITGSENPSFKSDLYSLGMIGLDLLSKEPLSRERIGGRLEQIWENPATVGIAQLIEDLIDESPDKRALVLSKSPADLYYQKLKPLVEEQTEIYRHVLSKAGASVQLSKIVDVKLLPELIELIAFIFGTLKSKQSPYKTATRSMIACARLNSIAGFSIIVLFLAYTFLDLERYFSIKIPMSGTLIWITELIPRNFTAGDLWVNLPGRCIAITFGLLAAKFYANIFAQLRIVEFNHWRKPITNFFLRIGSFSYAPPIMVAIVYDPQLWPFCSAIGTIFPALTNIFCYHSAIIGARNLQNSDFTSEARFHAIETSRFLNDYKSWGSLMAYYSIGLLAIGVLLRTGYAVDAAIYAYTFSLLNIFQIYRNNCTRKAPGVRANLARLFFGLQRWQLTNSKATQM